MNINTSQPIIVSGYVKKATQKAVQMHCNADQTDRWFARSQCKFNQAPEPGLVLRARVPLWLLKRRDGTYPAWARGRA